MADLTQGVSIGVAGDTKAFDKAVRTGMVEPLDDAADKLRELDRRGDLNALERGMDDAGDASQRLERELDDVVDKLKATGRAGKSSGTDIRKGLDDAEEGVETLRENVGSNAKEMAASFDGSVDSMSDAVQGLIAEMTEGFGPAGLAAGVIVASGLGLAQAAGQATADSLNDAKERAIDLAQEIQDAGGDISKVDVAGKMREWATTLSDNVEWFEFWQREALTNMDKVVDRAKLTGVGITDMFAAMSGLDADAARDVLAEVDDQIAEIQRTIDSQDNWNVVDALGLSDADGKLYELTNLRREIQLASGVTEDAIELQDRLAEVTAEYTAQAEAAAAAEQARNDAIAVLQGAIDGAIGSYQSFTDAETGATDPAAFIANMEARRNAVADFNSNVQNLASQFGFTQEEMQYVLDQGLDFAPMLQSIIDSGMSGQFAAQVQAAVGGGQDVLNGSSLHATVSVSADQKPAESALAEVENRDRTAEVKAQADPAEADRQLAELASRQRVATITARLDAGGVEAALNSLARNRSMTITARVVDQNGRTVYQ